MSASKLPHRVAASALPVLLSACGTRSLYRIGLGVAPQIVDDAPKVIVIDNRPTSDKEFSAGSFFVARCAYGKCGAQ